MKSILVSGFEPFGGETVNPSAAVAMAADGKTAGQATLKALILPVCWETGPARLLEGLEQSRPDALLMLGQGRRCTGLTLERVAVNLRSGADSSGCEVRDLPVVEAAPAAYLSTLPLADLLRVLREEGLPATLSSTAGLYLCNAAFYSALHYLAGRGRPIPAGFIHLPYLPEQAAAKDPPPASMNREDLVRGLLLVAATLAG